MKSFYLCGPTVYSKPHIGNLRPIITFDIFVRAWRSAGHPINFIHNITDIDDKIIAEAKRRKKSEEEITSEFTELYLTLLKDVNVDTPTIMPGVVNHIDDIIMFISRLLEEKKAYVAEGNVYFDVSQSSTYGSLSNRRLEEMEFEDEGDVLKRHPADFAVWKRTNNGMNFQSPWGVGRPGWHTECVAFIERYNNGTTLDYHGGGNDLKFPHHENEEAQFRAVHHIPLAKEWKHFGQIELDGQKMSKSKGNVWNADEFIAKHGSDTLRMIFLTTSVTAPVKITKKIIENAKTLVEKYEKAYKKAQVMVDEDSPPDPEPSFIHMIQEWDFAAVNKFVATALKEFNKKLTPEACYEIITLLNILGFKFTTHMVNKQDKEHFKKWTLARELKDYKEADKYRAKLIKKGIL